MAKPYVIVVDDDPDIAGFVEVVAGHVGFEVRKVGTGAELQEIWADRAPDLLVLDLVMPELDGFDLLRWLATQDRRVPVIVISGYDRGSYLGAAERLAEFKQVEIVAALPKPLDSGDLEAALKTALTGMEDTG